MNANSNNEMEYFPLVSRLESPLWVSLVCTGGEKKYYQKALGWDFSIDNYKYENRTHQIGKPDAIRLVDVIDEFAREGDFYGFYLERCERGVHALLNRAENVFQLSLSEFPEKRGSLFSPLNDVFQLMLENMPFLASLVLIQNRLETELRQNLAAEFNVEPDSRKVNEFLGVVMVAPKQSNFVKESRNVLRLAAEVQKITGSKTVTFDQLPLSLQQEIDQHIFEFGWLGTFTFFNDPYSREDIITRINLNLKRDPSRILNETISREQTALSLADRAIETISDSELRKLLHYAREYLFWRFERVDAFFKAEVLTRGLQEQIAREMGIARNEIPLLVYQELLDWFDGESSIPEESERLLRKQLGINYYVTDGKHRFELGRPIDFTIDPDLRQSVFDVGLEGTTACQGHVKGTVKIVRSVADIHKVHEGDILVTSMTTPDLMLAIEKAAAIITDEGGILCHAAIISRELNIPCVIGTNKATKSLQDGDLIELNADSDIGLVTLLQH